MLEFLETRDCPSGLDVLPFLYVANFGTGAVRQYSATGADLGVLASGLSGPSDQLAFDSSGNLYVPENAGSYCYGCGSIRRYSPSGVDLGVFASTGLNGPEGLAFDKAGNVYVGNNSGGTIRKFSPTGVDLGDFVTGINLNWDASTPDIIRDLAFDSAENLYVAERANGVIRRFSPTGVDLGNFASGLRGPIGLAFDTVGNLYVSEESAGDIRRFSPTGVDLGVFDLPGPTESANQLMFDPSSGDLFTVDVYTGHILRYSSVGGTPQVFAFNTPGASGIAIRPPLNSPPTADAGGTYTVVRGGTVQLDASGSSDPDQSNSSLNYAWDFDGDGQYDDATGSNPDFTAHCLAAGDHIVGLQVTDAGGLSATATATVHVEIIALLPDSINPSTTALYVGGTCANDTIVFSPVGNSGSVKVQLNGTDLGGFSGMSRIAAYGQDGDDDIQVAGSVATSAWLFGGNGNDRIKGGAGNDVLMGESGDDLLSGSDARDLLVGGTGADRIVGNAGDDILIAGTTAFDASDSDLSLIMREWTRSDASFATRVSHLQAGGGLNAGKLLSDATVHDDRAEDVLTGCEGNDWFLFNGDGDGDGGVRDKVTDLATYEATYAEDIDWLNL